MEKQMLAGKTAIITGASYGMGRTMAELFAEENASVILTTHRDGKLNQVKEFNGAPSVVRGMIANPERLSKKPSFVKA